MRKIDVMNIRESENYYNKGVVFEAPCGLRSEVTPVATDVKKSPFHLAIFDMDGTSINTSSPLRLVRMLLAQGRLAPNVAARIIKWALSYKFHLPRQNDPVRENVFTAFEGQDAFEVSREFEKFAEDKIVPFIREDAVSKMREHEANGLIVILLSASFDSVLSRMLLDIPANYGIATIMHIDDNGKMTNKVEGTSPEGTGKPIVLKQFANAKFGEGNWVVDFAYGDHMSDVDVLSMAKHPVAVTPDRQLKKHAIENGWEIAEW